MPEYRMPGVYVEELTSLPPAVADVATAVPLFIGYTAQAGELPGVSQRIRSLAEFEACFGKGAPCRIGKVEVDKAGCFLSATIAMDYYLHDALRRTDTQRPGAVFARRGGACPPEHQGGKHGIRRPQGGCRKQEPGRDGGYQRS